MSYLGVQDAQEVLVKRYGVIPKQAKKMNAYQQVNFKVTLPEKEMDEGIVTQSYILKFTDTTHFSYCANLELQHAMLRHLHTRGLPTSLPVATTEGGTITEYLHGGKPYKVQMLPFIDGVSINEADFSRSEVEKISQDVGHLLGNIHRNLTTLEYDIETASSLYSPYHIQNALVFRGKVDYVKDKSTRQLIEKSFFSYETLFLSQLAELRKGFIHGDCSDSNIIVRKDGTTWKITGVIDFEECCYGYMIGDVAISIAYVMLKAAASGTDPLEASRLALQAYESHIPLTTMEKRTLFDGVSSRMAVSYVSASYEAYFNPENCDFIFSQAKTVPVVLRHMEEFGRRRIEEFWFEET